MIISLPVQTAVCWSRPEGALLVVTVVQVSFEGLYRPPWLIYVPPLLKLPPQTIISAPVHTAECPKPPNVGPVPATAVQRFATGSYRPPLFKGELRLFPAQIIISLPVHTAV